MPGPGVMASTTAATAKARSDMDGYGNRECDRPSTTTRGLAGRRRLECPRALLRRADRCESEQLLRPREQIPRPLCFELMARAVAPQNTRREQAISMGSRHIDGAIAHHHGRCADHALFQQRFHLLPLLDADL